PRVNYQVSGSDFANINDDVLMNSRGYFGTLTLDPQTFLSNWTSSQVVNIHVEPGYRFFELSASVGRGATNPSLDVLRVQQRLQFFAYVGYEASIVSEAPANNALTPLGLSNGADL